MKAVQMLLFEPESGEAQEWAIAQSVVRESVGDEPHKWEALAALPVIEIYTDGSAPVRNPGGPAGFSAVVVGFSAAVPKNSPKRPSPDVRLDLGGYVPARNSGAQTSNNRAEIGGVMAAVEAIRHLLNSGWVGREVTVWSDSRYAVMCATGVWKRKKNTDLWAMLDGVLSEVVKRVPKQGFRLLWVKGHAGNEFNEAADELATLAAFNFSKEAHARFRAAQVATGKEMPGEAAIGAVEGEGGEGAEKKDVWIGGADYALAISTSFKAQDQRAGTGTAVGHYRLWSKNGQSREADVKHEGKRLPDEFEYMTLIVALGDMVKRITARERDPKEFEIQLYSGRELMTKQLTGEYKVKSAVLQEPYREAAALLKRFKRVEILWKRGGEMGEVMRDGPI